MCNGLFMALLNFLNITFSSYYVADLSRESWSLSTDSLGPMLTKKSLKDSAIAKLSEIIESAIFYWECYLIYDSYPKGG